jgi:hypothetical protein
VSIDIEELFNMSLCALVEKNKQLHEALDAQREECSEHKAEAQRLRAVLVSLRSAGGWVQDLIDLELKDV